MGDREHARRQHHQAHGMEAESVSTPQNDAHDSSGPPMRYGGAIPPVLAGFQEGKPSASDRAYGARDRYRRPATEAAATKPQSQGQAIARCEDSADESVIAMPPDYVGSEPGEKFNYEGAVCERPGAVGICYMEPAYRKRKLHQLRTNIDTARTSYVVALQIARLDELLKKAPKLGLAAELLIGAISVIGGALLNGAAAMAIKELNRRDVWNGMMKPDQFEGAVLAQSAHVRSVISEVVGIAKGRAKLAFTGATPQSQIKEAFLSRLINDAGPLFHTILQNILDTGDDFAIAVAANLFNPDVFTVNACSHQIRSMLDRLENQHLDEIGPVTPSPAPDAGETEVVQLQAFGRRRLAVIRFSHRVKLGTSYGADWYTREGEEFLNWVDGDFGEFATSVQESRNGAMKTIDVSLFQDRFGPEVKTWIDHVRTGSPR